MDSVHEILTEQFRQWELRGRGWRVFDEPVAPEPPFAPFYGYHLPTTTVVDDGRRPTVLSSFMQKLSQRMGAPPPAPPVVPEEEPEPEPERLTRDALVEFQTSLPAKLDISREAFAEFLSSVSLCREPIAFELLGTTNQITTQFAVHPADASVVQRELQAYFPEATFVPKAATLQTAWQELADCEIAVLEFGLAHEFMLPLATTKLDPFVGLIGTLNELADGESGLFQVLFQSVGQPWADSIQRIVIGPDGTPVFVNAPELIPAVKQKVSRPLYGTVVRIAALGPSFDSAWGLARDMAASLRVFAHPSGNELIPLANDEYPHEDHVEDVIRRQSRRSGMLLNSDELIGFVHLPSSTVRSPKLMRQMVKTKAAPKALLIEQGLLLGHNTHAGKSTAIRLSPDQRVRHTHIIGAPGTGKSTLLFNLIQQDIKNGAGVAVLDPHGDLVERILGSIPPERIDDVILIDPSDEDYSVGFNVLSAHSDWEKNMLAADLVSVFERLSTSWGDQMASVLDNAIRAFLESDAGGTLADLQRFLIEPAFRNAFLKTVRDPAVAYYWQKGFPQLSGNKSIGPILTRLNTLLGPKPIRYMVSQKENRLNFSAIMNEQKILLAKLPKGLLGDANTYLLGTLLVSKLQQTAMSRQRVREEDRPYFWLHIDEFHNFITPSMAEILTGARKYHMGMVLANQDLQQLQRNKEVASGLSNLCARIVFRVGDADARALEAGFSTFEARDLQNLGRGEAIVRLERSDFDFNLSIVPPENLDESAARQRREEVIAASRARYGVSRAQIEAQLPQPLEFQTSAPATEPALTQKTPTLDKVLPKEAPASFETTPPPPAAVAPVEQSSKGAEKKNSTDYADLGLGGAQHKAIQERLKVAAEGCGFHGRTEEKILDSLCKVDLLLERDDQVIACEISVTTTVDNEVGNVRKCLKAGYPQVAVICVDERHSKKIATAVAVSLGLEAAKCVAYFNPDQFISHLKTLAPPPPSAPAQPEVKHGFKIKRTRAQLPPEELQAREEAALKQITETMRRKPKPPAR